MGAFIYGLDTDTPETIYDRTSYIIEEDIDMMQASILTPLPGTSLYNRLKEEERLLYTDYPKDWERHGFFDLVFKPKLVSPEELEEAIFKNWEKLYDLKVLKKKFLRTLQLTKNPTAAVWAITSNLQMRNMVFEGTKPALEPEEAFPGLLEGIALR
jgi:radical SAM superfamily enzyme YgiQ (UPF0313 family)